MEVHALTNAGMALWEGALWMTGRRRKRSAGCRALFDDHYSTLTLERLWLAKVAVSLRTMPWRPAGRSGWLNELGAETTGFTQRSQERLDRVTHVPRMISGDTTFLSS